MEASMAAVRSALQAALAKHLGFPQPRLFLLLTVIPASQWLLSMTSAHPVSAVEAVSAVIDCRPPVYWHVYMHTDSCGVLCRVHGSLLDITSV